MLRFFFFLLGTATVQPHITALVYVLRRARQWKAEGAIGIHNLYA